MKNDLWVNEFGPNADFTALMINNQGIEIPKILISKMKKPILIL